MSRALGAAFLHHQVEQLEKSVSSNGPASGNWRDRKSASGYAPSGGAKRGSNSHAAKAHRKKAPGGDGGDFPALERTSRDKTFDRNLPGVRRRSAEEERKEKDADVVVVDASVLIHALYQVKKWCRDGREEIVIVPLEGAIQVPSNMQKAHPIPSAEYSRSSQEGDFLTRSESSCSVEDSRSTSRNQPSNSGPARRRLRLVGPNYIQGRLCPQFLPRMGPAHHLLCSLGDRKP